MHMTHDLVQEGNSDHSYAILGDKNSNSLNTIYDRLQTTQTNRGDWPGQDCQLLSESEGGSRRRRQTGQHQSELRWW